MNQRKMLSAVILLILAKSACGTTELQAYKNIATSQPPPYVFKNSIKNPVTSYKNALGSVQDVNFFKIVNDDLTNPNPETPFPTTDVTLNFSCTHLNHSSGSAFGWYYSIWKHIDDSTPDLKVGGGEIVNEDCGANPYPITLLKNESTENAASYYVGIQSNCAAFPNNPQYINTTRVDGAGFITPKDCEANTTIYTLTLEPITKIDTNVTVISTISLSKSELESSIPLGSIKTGRMISALDESNKIIYPANIYSAETYSTTDTAGTADVPLLFSCTAAAARQTNDWKLTVYDDKNTVVTGYPRFINGSDCGSTLVDDKGGFKFTLPKDSPRYFVSVQSACDSQSKKKCNVETSQYNIARDVTRIYTGNLSATKNITATNASFKLTRCGLNSNSTIAVKVENADLRDIFKATKSADKKPIKLQIGTMVCQILTPNSFLPAELMLGSITGNAEIIDAQLIAKDSATVTLSECVSSNAPDFPSKITLTGTKLDLENLNPVLTTTTTSTTATTATGNPIAPPATTTSVSNSVVIPVKVDIGEFHCEGKDAFYVNADKPKVGDTTYSFIGEIAPVVSTDTPDTSVIVFPVFGVK